MDISKIRIMSFNLEKLMDIFNSLSDDVVATETIIKKVNQVPLFEML